MSKTSQAITLLTALAGDAIGVRGRSVAYPRASLQSWLRELSEEAPATTKGRVAILAMRNKTWIEWAIYTACWMRKLGYAPIVLYSGPDVRRMLDQPGLRNKLTTVGLWKLVAKIPDVEL